jgi:AraC-like DNA-binding protein
MAARDFVIAFGFIIATITTYVASAGGPALLARRAIRARRQRRRNPGEEMIRAIALLLFIAALVERGLFGRMQSRGGLALLRKGSRKMDLSGRSLQRHLGIHNTTFEGVMDRVLTRHATTLLEQGEMQITQVAMQLG